MSKSWTLAPRPHPRVATGAPGGRPTRTIRVNHLTSSAVPHALGNDHVLTPCVLSHVHAPARNTLSRAHGRTPSHWREFGAWSDWPTAIARASSHPEDRRHCDQCLGLPQQAIASGASSATLQHHPTRRPWTANWCRLHEVRAPPPHIQHDAHCAAATCSGCAHTTHARLKSRRCRFAWYDRHCLSSYETMDRHEVGFCVLRDPLARAVSSYNMLPLLSARCNPSHLNAEIRRVLALGHHDNHDIPQSLYARHCRHLLCYERLEDDFRRLLREQQAVRVVRPNSLLSRSILKACRREAAGVTNVSATPHHTGVQQPRIRLTEPCAAALQWIRARRNRSKAAVRDPSQLGQLLWPMPSFAGFPHVRPAALGQRQDALAPTPHACTPSHLSVYVRGALLERYRHDVALREARGCTKQRQSV